MTRVAPASNNAIPLTSPPDGAFPLPPVQTAAMSLPFGELTWENFERLCYRLAGRAALIDTVARYGRQGQAQEGIDIFARKTNGRYEVWQAKRYKSFSADQIRKAVKAFTTGSWVGKADKLVIAIQANLDDVKIQDEIEKQTELLAKSKIALVVLGGDRLVDQIRPFQDLVLAFFGRSWLKAFYGELADPVVSAKLDGEEFARARAQISRLYTARFSDLDQGIIASRFAGSSAPQRPIALLDRYAMPDVYIRDRADQPSQPSDKSPSEASSRKSADGQPQHTRAAETEVRRVAVDGWLFDADQFAVVADAGAGKSTLLRCIALDILGAQTVFPALGSRWGDRLPIIVSFAKWARATAEKGSEVGLKELVDASLQPLLTVDLVGLVNRAIDESRIVLIVDGLDEWSAEQAARLTLQTLLTYVEVHHIPIVASGRPLGLRKIGTLPQSWKTAELAPLSTTQQRTLAQTWFDHLVSESQEADGTPSSVATWRTDRFLKELQTDRALGELAETPLLFVGLLALAVRDIALPRNRTQAFQSLIRLLLEIHPESRATAAGDVSSRFVAARSTDLRQAALGALAFASRRDGGDAGYSRSVARSAIREYLIAANGYDASRADAVADEILAVNAETIGLIVEKGPNDIGFAHASLEEFLSAVHIHSWRFSELLAFVTEHAGDPRWRNVLRDLVALNTRTSEIDDIVAAIEGADLDVLGAINRRRLLAEITFSPSAIASGTAHRLASQAFEFVEGLGAEVERIAILRLALNGLGDPVLNAALDERIGRWAPRTLKYTAHLYQALSRWEADPALLEILMAALKDEEREGARTAAQVLAAKFSDQADVGARLRAMICGTSNLNFVAAALEALVLGWPGSATDEMVANARSSRSPLLRAVAIWAKVMRQQHDAVDRQDCLQMIGFHSPLDYTERAIANEALFAGWPDDDGIVADALKTLGYGGPAPDTIDRDLAVQYLLNTTPGRSTVQTWILDNLKQEHPFVLLGGATWRALVKYCDSSTAIREAVIMFIGAGTRKYREREVWDIIAYVKDDRLRDYAIEQALGSERSGQYWSLLPLVEGWADDPVVQKVFDQILARSDDELDMVVALLPRLYANPAHARDRLLRVARDVPNARYDLIAGALAALGVNGDDSEAVEALLPHAQGPSQAFANADSVFTYLATSPKVREAALARLAESDPPLAQIARGMPDDPTVRAYVANMVHAAPRALRSVIVAACGTSADRNPPLFELLADYDREVDFQLKVQLAIDFYKLHYARGSAEALIPRLQAEAERRGPDYEEYRATAFAGLVAIHSPATIRQGAAAEREIHIGSFYRSGVSSALCSLIVDNWDELKEALGDDFAEKQLKTLDGTAWSNLARFAATNASARRDFVSWCEKVDQIDLSALKVLAEVAPKSDALRRHVQRVLERRSDDRNFLPSLLAAASITREQFSDPAGLEAAVGRLKDRRDLYSALALSIIDPSNPILHARTITAIELCKTHGEWLGGVEMAARLEPPEMVVEVIHGLADRRVYPHWDKGLPLETLIDRIIRDPETRDVLRESLDGQLSAGAFCASAKMLAAAGVLDASGWDLCAQKLLAEQANPGVPIAVLDISSDQIRPLSHVLTDLFQARSLL